MHDLLFTLQDHDIGHLKIIAEYWGLDLPAGTALVVAEWLAAAMLDPNNLLEVIDSLPELARQPWDDLLHQDGRSPYADMVRRYGAIREMGVGRRDRQKPWRDPISGLEILWYRGLIARSFVETKKGPQEYLYIPSDMYDRLPKINANAERIPGRETVTPLHMKPATITIIDDVTTLLASLRREPYKSTQLDPRSQSTLTPFLHHPKSQELIFTLLKELGMLSSPPIQPLSEPTRQHFASPKRISLVKLLQTWKDSTTWNDLQHVDGISAPADEWPNDPLVSRHAVLDFLTLVPTDKWWDMESFIQFIHYHQPGFLRPAGDFDSWYFQNSETGEFLRGFDYWNSIEGALIRYILTQPLHFLGAVDLGGVDQENPNLSFRLTALSRTLCDDDVQVEIPDEPDSVKVFPDGTILASPASSQAHRYQIARFCEWIDLSAKGFRYRLTPSALQRAKDQELSLSQVKSILEAANQDNLHPSLERALARWGEEGREAYIEMATILRIKNRQVMEILQSNSSTSRFLHEILGPTTATVKEKDIEKLFTAASRLGILVDIP